jgi:hypothetical protein
MPDSRSDRRQRHLDDVRDCFERRSGILKAEHRRVDREIRLPSKISSQGADRAGTPGLTPKPVNDRSQQEQRENIDGRSVDQPDRMGR